jgi:hypothetical protein
VTVPFALPVAPDVIAMKLALLTDVHAHPDGAVNVTDPVLDAAGTDNDVAAVATTVQDGVVVVPLSFEHADAASARRAAPKNDIKKRRHIDVTLMRLQSIGN